MSHVSDIRFVKRSMSANAVFSILIPTWNNLPYLKLCIDSIRKHSTLQHQLIVHINEGNDGTREWVASQSDIDYTASDTNIGVCYALNAAAQLASTNYILYLNDDMYTCPQWDKYLLEEINAVGHDDFFISGTAIEPVAESICSIEKNYGADIESFNEALLLNEFAALPFSDWLGATWPPNVLHKKNWDLVGGYSTEFTPGMYSDPDFSMKLWQAGIRFFKGASKSRVYHFGSRSVKRVAKNPGYYTFISKWGMSSSTVTKIYLRRGVPFDGQLTEPRISQIIRVKNLFKRIVAAFKRSIFFCSQLQNIGETLLASHSSTAVFLVASKRLAVNSFHFVFIFLHNDFSFEAHLWGHFAGINTPLTRQQFKFFDLLNMIEFRVH